MNKPFASVSLDLDNQWCYLKNNGDPSWEKFPSYLDIFIPYVLEILDSLNLKLTFFIVGQDAVQEQHHKFIKNITNYGHEIANHSFKHDTWLHLYTQEELMEEINRSHEIITKVSGREPKGFRGPGFTYSESLMEILADKGYDYDASTFPTFIGPLARWFYFKNSNLSREEKKSRKSLFGKFSDGFKKLKPHYWQLKHNRQLLEIPVTTMPIFRVPIHLTYLIYLSGFSVNIMAIYLHFALFLCKLTKTQPSFLIHPLDLLGKDQISGMDFFPGMKMSSEKKLMVFKKVINKLEKHYTLVTMERLASSIWDKHKSEMPEYNRHEVHQNL